MLKLALLCLLPFVMSAPSERFIIDSFGGSIFNMERLKCDVQLILDVVGQDASELACENECHTLLQEGHVMNYGCPLICKGAQQLAQTWHLVPETTDPSICAGV